MRTSGASWLLPLLGASVLLALTSRAIAIAPEKSNQLLDWVVLAAVLVAMVALYEAAGGALPWLSSRRPHSTLGNRNFVAADCAVALILAIYRSLRRPGVVSAVAVVVLTTVVLVTRCRSAWLGLLVVAGLTPVLLGRLAWRSLRDFSPFSLPCGA